MADIKISIIMPVYGVEAFVGRAIESLQAQTLTEWELLAVDDGSKDRSGEICDEYALKDPRIRVIHKENGGVSSTRNHAGRRCKRLIHCGLVGVVRWLLCIAIAIIRSTIRCVGARVVWRVALRGGIYLRRKRHCTYIHQNAYHNDMQRPVKEAFRIGEMIVFVSHGCI